MDIWHTHVRSEIQNATFDKDRLLEITRSLVAFENSRLVPDPIASDLFNLIVIHNTEGQ